MKRYKSTIQKIEKAIKPYIRLKRKPTVFDDKLIAGVTLGNAFPWGSQIVDHIDVSKTFIDSDKGLACFAFRLDDFKRIMPEKIELIEVKTFGQKRIEPMAFFKVEEWRENLPKLDNFIVSLDDLHKEFEVLNE